MGCGMCTQNRVQPEIDRTIQLKKVSESNLVNMSHPISLINETNGLKLPTFNQDDLHNFEEQQMSHQQQLNLSPSFFGQNALTSSNNQVIPRLTPLNILRNQRSNSLIKFSSMSNTNNSEKNSLLVGDFNNACLPNDFISQSSADKHLSLSSNSERKKMTIDRFDLSLIGGNCKNFYSSQNSKSSFFSKSHNSITPVVMDDYLLKIQKLEIEQKKLEIQKLQQIAEHDYKMELEKRSIAKSDITNFNNFKNASINEDPPPNTMNKDELENIQEENSDLSVLQEEITPLNHSGSDHIDLSKNQDNTSQNNTIQHNYLDIKNNKLPKMFRHITECTNESSINFDIRKSLYTNSNIKSNTNESNNSPNSGKLNENAVHYKDSVQNQNNDTNETCHIGDKNLNKDNPIRMNHSMLYSDRANRIHSTADIANSNDLSESSNSNRKQLQRRLSFEEKKCKKEERDLIKSKMIKKCDLQQQQKLPKSFFSNTNIKKPALNDKEEDSSPTKVNNFVLDTNRDTLPLNTNRETNSFKSQKSFSFKGVRETPIPSSDNPNFQKKEIPHTLKNLSVSTNENNSNIHRLFQFSQEINSESKHIDEINNDENISVSEDSIINANIHSSKTQKGNEKKAKKKNGNEKEGNTLANIANNVNSNHIPDYSGGNTDNSNNQHGSLFLKILNEIKDMKSEFGNMKDQYNNMSNNYNDMVGLSQNQGLGTKSLENLNLQANLIKQVAKSGPSNHYYSGTYFSKTDNRISENSLEKNASINNDIFPTTQNAPNLNEYYNTHDYNLSLQNQNRSSDKLSKDRVMPMSINIKRLDRKFDTIDNLKIQSQPEQKLNKNDCEQVTPSNINKNNKRLTKELQHSNSIDVIAQSKKNPKKEDSNAKINSNSNMCSIGMSELDSINVNSKHETPMNQTNSNHYASPIPINRRSHQDSKFKVVGFNTQMSRKKIAYSRASGSKTSQEQILRENNTAQSEFIYIRRTPIRPSSTANYNTRKKNTYFSNASQKGFSKFQNINSGRNLQEKIDREENESHFKQQSINKLSKEDSSRKKGRSMTSVLDQLSFSKQNLFGTYTLEKNSKGIGMTSSNKIADDVIDDDKKRELNLPLTSQCNLKLDTNTKNEENQSCRVSLDRLVIPNLDKKINKDKNNVISFQTNSPLSGIKSYKISKDFVAQKSENSIPNLSPNLRVKCSSKRSVADQKPCKFKSTNRLIDAKHIASKKNIAEIPNTGYVKIKQDMTLNKCDKLAEQESMENIETSTRRFTLHNDLTIKSGAQQHNDIPKSSNRNMLVKESVDNPSINTKEIAQLIQKGIGKKQIPIERSSVSVSESDDDIVSINYLKKQGNICKESKFYSQRVGDKINDMKSVADKNFMNVSPIKLPPQKSMEISRKSSQDDSDRLIRMNLQENKPYEVINASNSTEQIKLFSGELVKSHNDIELKQLNIDESVKKLLEQPISVNEDYLKVSGEENSHSHIHYNGKLQVDDHNEDLSSDESIVSRENDKDNDQVKIPRIDGYEDQGQSSSRESEIYDINNPSNNFTPLQTPLVKCREYSYH